MEVVGTMQFSLSLTAAMLATVGFLGLAVFQVLLALGYPLGRAAWGGKHERLPANLRIASAISAVVFLAAVILVLERAGMFTVLGNSTLVTYGVWALVVLLGLSALGNFASSSDLEKRIMAPVALVLCLLCVVVALGL